MRFGSAIKRRQYADQDWNPRGSIQENMATSKRQTDKNLPDARLQRGGDNPETSPNARVKPQYENISPLSWAYRKLAGKKK